MSEGTTINFTSGFGVLADELQRLLVRDFTPVMAKIRDRYMEPLARSAWASSGLKSRTGELAGAVTPFAGKVSAGIGLRTTKGKDLVLAKAYAHTFGRKKASSKRGVNRKTRKYKRPSPWGDIPARPFIPSALPSHLREPIENMIKEYIRARLGRTR
jgi:hypothetical protein